MTSQRVDERRKIFLTSQSITALVHHVYFSSIFDPVSVLEVIPWVKKMKLLIAKIGFLFIVLKSACTSNAALRSLDTAPVAHFTLDRRGGPFSTTQWPLDVANLTYLNSELAKAEGRFNNTKREVKGNRVVRVIKSNGRTEGKLIGEISKNGIW